LSQWLTLATFNLSALGHPVILGVTFFSVKFVSHYISIFLAAKSCQLLDHSPESLQGSSRDSESAPVGVNPQCGIPRIGHNGSISNVANIAACGVSILIVALLIFLCNRRKAAVGES